MIVGELVFCIAIGIFTVFIVSIISILLVIAELVLMMFPDLRVPWTITDNFLWEIEEDICQNEIKKKGGLIMTLNEYNYLQSRFSRKLKKPDYTSKNAGYNAGISECRSIIKVEYNRMVEKEDQMDLPEYVCLQDRFSHALKNPAHTNRESSYNAAILSCKSILKEVFNN